MSTPHTLECSAPRYPHSTESGESKRPSLLLQDFFLYALQFALEGLRTNPYNQDFPPTVAR